MMTRHPIINLLRPFLAGCANDAGCSGGTAGGGAVIVGASNCLPQLRQNLSPGAAGVPQCGQIVAFNVGSLICLRVLGLFVPRSTATALQTTNAFGADASI